MINERTYYRYCRKKLRVFQGFNLGFCAKKNGGLGMEI